MTRATPIPSTVTLHVPFRVAKRGGRKEMQLAPGAPPQRKTDNTLIKALARAFRWKCMLESGEFATISDILPAIVTLDSQEPKTGKRKHLASVTDFACGSGSEGTWIIPIASARLI